MTTELTLNFSARQIQIVPLIPYTLAIQVAAQPEDGVRAQAGHAHFDNLNKVVVLIAHIDNLNKVQAGHAQFDNPNKIQVVHPQSEQGLRL
jgi:hypothetical protein